MLVASCRPVAISLLTRSVDSESIKDFSCSTPVKTIVQNSVRIKQFSTVLIDHSYTCDEILVGQMIFPSNDEIVISSAKDQQNKERTKQGNEILLHLIPMET